MMEPMRFSIPVDNALYCSHCGVKFVETDIRFRVTVQISHCEHSSPLTRIGVCCDCAVSFVSDIGDAIEADRDAQEAEPPPEADERADYDKAGLDDA